MAASSEELSSQADQLKEVIGFDMGSDIRSNEKAKEIPMNIVHNKSYNGNDRNGFANKKKEVLHTNGYGGINLNMNGKDVLDDKYEKF